MGKKQEKTNVMRVLDRYKIEYEFYNYDNSALSGVEICEALNIEISQLFKTLVTVGKSGEHYVFMVPSSAELDLKKAAKAAKEKSIEMIPQKTLLPLTGYIHGGCSPIGMKKQFKTFINESAEEFDKIYFSGGKVGHQVSLSLADLRQVIRVVSADIIKTD